MSTYEMWEPVKQDKATAIAEMTARIDALKATAVDNKVRRTAALSSSSFLFLPSSSFLFGDPRFTVWDLHVPRDVTHTHPPF
jgi:hypothetical protein